MVVLITDGLTRSRKNTPTKDVQPSFGLSDQRLLSSAILMIKQAVDLLSSHADSGQ